eukprot:5194670-Pyramimonas_sp.AAC.1
MHASGRSTQTPAQLMDARQCVLLGRDERAFTLCLSEAQLVLDLHNTPRLAIIIPRSKSLVRDRRSRSVTG